MVIRLIRTPFETFRCCGGQSLRIGQVKEAGRGFIGTVGLKWICDFDATRAYGVQIGLDAASFVVLRLRLKEPESLASAELVKLLEILCWTAVVTTALRPFGDAEARS